MSNNNKIILSEELKENEDFFRRYLYFLLKRKYFFSKKPEEIEEIIVNFGTALPSGIIDGFSFTPIVSSFFTFISIGANEKDIKDTFFPIKAPSELLFQEKSWMLINNSLNDLYTVNKNLGRISYLKLFLKHSTNEISEIIGVPEMTVIRELEFSKAFMIGWIARDKHLDRTIFPLLGERQIVDFFEDNKTFEEIDILSEDSEYIKELEKVSLEIDSELSNLKQINSNLLAMTKIINSKLNNK